MDPSLLGSLIEDVRLGKAATNCGPIPKGWSGHLAGPQEEAGLSAGGVCAPFPAGAGAGSTFPAAQAPEPRAPGGTAQHPALPPGQAEVGRAQDSEDTPAAGHP